jgi:hypothetical protein
LFKGFLQVTPGALQEIDGLSVTGIHPLQKIYVDSRRNTVGWYCDGVAALCCADAARRDSAAFQRDVAGLMTAEVAQLTPDMFLDQPATLHFWPSGVTYGPRLASDNPTVLILEHGVVVASDCLAEPIGWLEGAIESGRAAAKLVGADS